MNPITEKIKEWLNEPYTPEDRNHFVKIGMLDRLAERGISPEKAGRALSKLADNQDRLEGRPKKASVLGSISGGIAKGGVWVAGLSIAAVPVSYIVGRHLGSISAGSAHDAKRNISRLDDKDIVDTRRRARHVLALTQDLEGDLGSIK